MSDDDEEWIDTEGGTTVAEVNGFLLNVQEGELENVKFDFQKKGYSFYPSIVAEPGVPETETVDTEYSSSNPYIEFVQKLEKIPGQLTQKINQVQDMLLGPRNPPAFPPQGQANVVAALAWHPMAQRIALALELNRRSDTNSSGKKYYIASYNVAFELWEHTSMKDDKLRDVRCMEWAPLASATIAVGCRTGVCLFRVDDLTVAHQRKFQSRSEQPWNMNMQSDFQQAADPPDYQNNQEIEDSAVWMRFLPQNSGRSVECLAWCNDGRLLACAAPADVEVTVWDVALGSCSPLRRLGFGHGACGLHWSPNGAFLFATTTGKQCVAWETQTWQAWKDLDWDKMPPRDKPGRCRAATWYRDSEGINKANVLLLASSNTVYSLRFSGSALSQVSSGSGSIEIGGDGGSGGTTEVMVAPTVQKLLPAPKGDNGRTVITEMCWDPTGSRLAIATGPSDSAGAGGGHGGDSGGDDGGDGGTGAGHGVAIYMVKHHPELSISSLGPLQPPANASSPHWIKFCKRFPRGALLSVCWNLKDAGEDKDLVVFYPMYFQVPKREDAVE